ncbi:MAG: type I-C CRISPR-associated protein Cas8c/Csd1 [Kiritimatiellia bacterium]
MSWIDKLYRTYESNVAAVVGKGDEDAGLLPICHTTQNAHIEITIDALGYFRRASVVSKADSVTIIPCTEKSVTTTGKKPIHHPLANKLQFVAGDFAQFGGEVTVGYLQTPEQPFENFMTDLKAWCESDYPHWKVRAVFQYLKKKSVVSDLVKARVLYLESSGERAGKLLYEWMSEEDTPEIFSLLSGKLDAEKERKPWQAVAFVRWRVEKAGVVDSSTQTDAELQQAWISYYATLKETKGICLVSGRHTALADSHPAKIRNRGDSAKLISSKDSSGFTYHGRFTEASQVCGVDFEISQKAYNALRWLIARQGWRSGSQAIVSWAVSGSEVPNVLKNTFALFGDDEDEEFVVNTAQQFGTQLSKRIAGYSIKLGVTDEIVVMGLDSATPGRMAIIFYRELTGSEFLKRIESWHRSCCWFQNFGEDTKFIGAPSPNDIAKAAYGKDVDDKLKRATISRLLPCIVDGMPLPKDLVDSCFHNAVRRSAFDVWEWEKILGITCALYRNYNKETEDYVMALDRNRITRDYLYGRLLAIGDCIEGLALKDADEKRPTSAARLMQRFADYPCSTWRNIELALVPYKARLGGRMKKYQPELDETMNLFNADEFADDKTPLSGEFLLGFHCQRTVLLETKNKTEGEENESN